MIDLVSRLPTGRSVFITVRGVGGVADTETPGISPAEVIVRRWAREKATDKNDELNRVRVGSGSDKPGRGSKLHYSFSIEYHTSVIFMTCDFTPK